MARIALEPYVRSLLRIVGGFTFSLHGFQKLFGLFGGMGGGGATVRLLTLMWVAGILEAFGGILILLGFFTQWRDGRRDFTRHFPRGF